MPAHGLRVGLTGGTFRDGDFGQFEPRMIGEHFYQTLADNSGGAEDAGFPFFFTFDVFTIHVFTFDIFMLRDGHSEPLRLDDFWKAAPIRVPRKCGLKVLRTHTVISVSAASGKTRG